jgi:hypothetical protein
MEAYLLTHRRLNRSLSSVGLAVVSRKVLLVHGVNLDLLSYSLRFLDASAPGLIITQNYYFYCIL